MIVVGGGHVYTGVALAAVFRRWEPLLLTHNIETLVDELQSHRGYRRALSPGDVMVLGGAMLAITDEGASSSATSPGSKAAVRATARAGRPHLPGLAANRRMLRTSPASAVPAGGDDCDGGGDRGGARRATQVV